ncbi:FAD-dependent oxidoreductase [Cystobacter fuscus]|uniref:FAD-dependent monooxygenase n=1 Tax=Cystobacter fuscus TaxID=43 RepID=UPI002B2BA370|nr:FAD-dependent oxidoreductase [Cystobacter fuscus]
MSTSPTPTSRPSRHVLIAGGGIGGLTLARALRQVGIASTVFERTEVLRPVGAGIIMQMNAMKALRAIGLAEAVSQEGQPLTTLATRTGSGGVLTRLDLELLSRELGESAIAIRRSRLQAVLLSGLEEGQVRTGRTVTGFRDDGERVTVLLSDGTTATGDLLVGADGLHSVVRQALWGDATRYSGYTSWRGMTTLPPQAHPTGASESWGPGARFGIVPVGHGEVYWYATRNAPAGVRDEPGRAHETLRQCFGGWHAPIAAILDATSEENIFRTDIHDRVPLARWSQGRVTLLGDAAHPMTPNMGQGGCQAIEDAVVLARCLAREPEPTLALAGYERHRLPRANQFVSRSFQLGRLAQLENTAVRFLRDTLMRLVPTGAALRQVRDVMRFEP